MLTLLAALLLTGPLPARAEDNPAASAAALDPADTDGDGTVSGKERRQRRRAERRARRGQRGANGEFLADEEADAAEAAESSARGEAASSKAAGAAAALKGMLPSADAGAFPGGGSPAPGEKPASGGRTSDAGPSASAGGSKSSPAEDSKTLATGDPGKPNAPSDFVLAARSGYEPAFAAAGLKLGPDGRSVVRLDGKPATAEDYARLRSEIASLPAALGRRPDFFSAVSPAHYADLKRGYKEKKEGDTVYKHVGTTAEDRDFVHTASCEKLSGDCNEHAVTASYKKGDFVAPEDLDSMWDALQKELDGSAEAGGLPSLAATRSGISRAAAVDAARALSEGGMDEEDAIRSATGEGPAPRPTAVSEAAASVQRLWKSMSASVVGPGNAAAAGKSSAPPLALGALAFAALGAGALFLRRKG